MEDKIGQFILWFVVLLFSLSFHEASHAWTAKRFGDPTAHLMGRVTLNPIRHIDLVGTLLFPIIAFFSGAPLIGWAKPVPVDTSRLRDIKKGHIMVSLAGPASNLLLAVIFLLLLRVFLHDPASTFGALGAVARPLFELLRIGIILNVALAVFNIIPIPPLDGHWVLYHLLPSHAAEVFDQLRPYGFILLYALLLTGAMGYIFRPAFWVIQTALG